MQKEVKEYFTEEWECKCDNQSRENYNRFNKDRYSIGSHLF